MRPSYYCACPRVALHFHSDSNLRMCVPQRFGVNLAELPAVAWVHRNETLSFDLIAMPESAEALVRWIFERMRVPNISVVNHAHVDAAVFLVDGVEPSGRYQWGKELGVAPAYGGRWTATEEVYLGNWYVCQPKHTLGDEIGLGSRLGEVFVNRAEEPHELVTPLPASPCFTIL